MNAKGHFHIRTFGCQMNVHDSEQLAALLEGEGYAPTNDPAEADVLVVNTCSIREKAAQKAYSELGRYARYKTRHPFPVIAVVGCLAQQEGGGWHRRLPAVDAVLGTHNLHLLPEILRDGPAGVECRVETAFRTAVPSLGILAPPEDGRVTAFVTIMQGCDNFCAYCVVPHLRGPEQSRPPEDILAEIRFLVDHGVREVTLLGQNVNSYGRKPPQGCDFAELLRRIGDGTDIERIRFTTSHPRDLSDGLIDCFRTVPALCEHIHLPVQAASNRILARMNRGYTAQEYLDRVLRLRQACPDISVTSDGIVGFPGETPGDFQEMIDLMENIRFDALFSFLYSERPNTPASLLDGKVPDDVKRERLQRLQRLQNLHTLERNRAWMGRIVPVLVEKQNARNPADLTGRTRTNRIVHFRGAAGLVGKTVAVKIVEAYAHSLRGELQGGELDHVD